MIEVWGFYLFSPGVPLSRGEAKPDDYQEAYDRYIDLWVSCERWGFDGLAWAEHHFNPMNLSPSPNLVVAAVAARTQRLRFTTLGAVLSMHDGRRYAEECGMLDYLSHGRFEPGIAPGAGPAEAIESGVPAEDVRPRYYSAAEVLSKSIAGPFVTHHDAYYNLDEVPISPRLHQTPGQSVWVTVMSPDSAAWCAERGWKMCTAWSPTPVVGALAAGYWEAAEAAGRPANPSMLGLRRRVFVADSDAEAREKYEAATDIVAALAGRGFETMDPKLLALMMQPDDFVIGSPETVAEQLIEQCRAGGYGVVMAFTDFALFAPEILARSHELLGTRVGPILHSADVARPIRSSEGGERPFSAWNAGAASSGA